MIFLYISLGLLGAWLVYQYQHNKVTVPEDHKAVVIDRQGFVKRVIPAGTHQLKFGLEKVEFVFEDKTKLAKGMATEVPTAEGILLNIQWSGTYTPDTDLITEKVSQRLRGLPKTEAALQRQVDIGLRRLVGAYTLRDLFKPAIRDRIERQLSETIKSKLRPTGVIFNGLDLQAIIPPDEVLHALNQAQAIQTLDQAIRASDGATRNLVAGAHQFEEMVEWSKLLPPYGRYALAQSGPSQ